MDLERLPRFARSQWQSFRHGSSFPTAHIADPVGRSKLICPRRCAWRRLAACDLAVGYSRRMRAEAVAFLRSLTPEQRRLAAFGIDSPERLDWHYVPRERGGLPLKAMDDRQRAAAHALLRAVLSDAGYRKATDIMRLETVLRAIETVRRFDRDPDNYAWSVFGDPDAGAPWGFRVEGHHLSLHLTFAAGPIAVTPAFMGANPARVPPLDRARRQLPPPWPRHPPAAPSDQQSKQHHGHRRHQTPSARASTDEGLRPRPPGQDPQKREPPRTAPKHRSPEFLSHRFL